MIALNNSLLNEYINFTIFNKKPTNIEKIQYLFKYLQPFKCNVNQYEIFNDPSLINKIVDNPIMKIVKFQTDIELVNSTKLKLMLVDEDIKESFTTVNIFQDEIDIRYSATYKSGKSREKAIEHIKTLISDATYINIIDRYLTSNWNENLKLLKKILPQTKISIFVDSENFSNQSDLKNFCNNWTIKTNNLNFKTTHDRYIKTDKLEIILTSGFEYIWNTTKDFTYLVKVIKKDYIVF
jgi:hypothetical protein